MSARKHRAENRRVYTIHEDLLRASCPAPFGSAELFKIIPDDIVSTELTLQSRKKTHIEVPFSGLSDLPLILAIGIRNNPAESMADFRHNSWGRIDWMEAMRSGEINPKSGVFSNEPMQVIDMDVIMKNTGNMDYVRFPHNFHIQWLACSNCHPNPFPYRVDIVKFSMNDVLVG